MNWNYEELDGVFAKNQQAINEGNEDNYFVEVVYRTEGITGGGNGVEEDNENMGGGLFD